MEGLFCLLLLYFVLFLDITLLAVTTQVGSYECLLGQVIKNI